MLLKQLSNTELSFLLSLSPYISYGTCALVRDDNVLNLRDISEITGLNYSFTRRLMASLISKGIIGKFITGSLVADNKLLHAYIVNPYVMSKGRAVDKTVVLLFAEANGKSNFDNSIPPS